MSTRRINIRTLSIDSFTSTRFDRPHTKANAVHNQAIANHTIGPSTAMSTGPKLVAPAVDTVLALVVGLTFTTEVVVTVTVLFAADELDALLEDELDALLGDELDALLRDEVVVVVFSKAVADECSNDFVGSAARDTSVEVLFDPPRQH